MPGTKKQMVRGLRFLVEPDDWLHRVLHWPFYFESRNYTFRVTIKRVATDDPADPWPRDSLAIVTAQEDGGMQIDAIPIPELALGETTVLTPLHWRDVFISRPGTAKLAIVANPQFEPNNERVILWELFTYRVRPEEAIWLAGGAVAIALFGVIVPIAAARFSDGPTVYNVLPTTVPTSIEGSIPGDTATPTLQPPS